MTRPVDPHGGGDLGRDLSAAFTVALGALLGAVAALSLLWSL